MGTGRTGRRGRLPLEGETARARTLVVARTDELSPDRRADIVRVCVAAHDEPDFERLFSYIPSGGRHFLAYRNRELASHAVVTTRWLHVGGNRLRTAYVDAVATLPEHQGQGFATAVMGLLAHSLDDYEIGCLETAKPAFYERLGWELWWGPLAGRTDDVVTPTPDQRGIMILQLPRTPAIDLDGELVIESQPGRIW